MANASIGLLESRDQGSLHSPMDNWLPAVVLPNAMLPDSKQQSKQQHQHSSERQLNSKAAATQRQEIEQRHEEVEERLLGFPLERVCCRRPSSGPAVAAGGGGVRQ